VGSKKMRVRVHRFLWPTEIASIRAKRGHAQACEMYPAADDDLLFMTD